MKQKNAIMHGDKKISIAIMSTFVVLTIQYLILIYFNLTKTPAGNSIQVISKAIVGLVYLYALPVVLRRHKIEFVGIYTLSIILFLLNYILFKENWLYLKKIIFPFFFICLPTLIYAYSVNNWMVLRDVMGKVSLIVFGVGSTVGLLVFGKRVSIGSYSMSLSYYLLLPSAFYINDFLDKFSFKSLVIPAISLLIVLALGSRGAILCVIIFIMLKLIIMARKLNYKIILLYLSIILAAIILYSFYNEILKGLSDLLAIFGIRSRNLKLFSEANLYMSGRDNLYEKVLGEVKQKPVLGLGLAGDRRILGGRYVHNLFIELFVGFGIFFGGLLIVLILWISYRGLFSKRQDVSGFVAIWLCLGFVPLIMSSSYLTDFRFWVLVGLASRLWLSTSKIPRNTKVGV